MLCRSMMYRRASRHSCRSWESTRADSFANRSDCRFFAASSSAAINSFTFPDSCGSSCIHTHMHREREGDTQARKRRQ